MNIYEQQWMTPPSSTENKNSSYFMEYVKPQESSVPLPHEDFTSYQQGYDQVDDFLTQTLSSLQELDIPVGESSSSNAFNQNQYSNTATQGIMRGHKKQPSGTAIFGFAGHNKTLSIPGVPQGIKHAGGKSNNFEHPSIAPNQLYPQAQQPTLYQKPQDIEAANHIHNQRQPYQQFQPIPMPHPQQYQHPPQPQAQVPRKSADDFVITNKAPNSYKFPPEVQVSASSASSAPQGQKTVSVPVEYLQRITNYIKSREDIDMNKFLDYGLDFSNGSNPRRSVSPNLPVDISPVLKQMEIQQQQPNTSESTEVNSPVRTPEEQQIAQSQPQSFHQQQQQQPSSSSQSNTIGLGIRFENNIKQDFESPESEFSEVPKTPSPILKSQAKFSSEQKPAELNWTPVIIGDKSLPMMKRKPQDKASTLPPGEIDHYVIGPREDKTYICNFKDCGKLFTRRYNVRSHVQTHLSDRPFICDFDGCHKAFVRQHDLTRHKKIHEEFEFKCPCGKRFSRHDALYRHRIRMICVGGIRESEEEQRLCADSGSSSLSLSSSSVPSSGIKTAPNSSIKKSKKKTNKPIRIENDQVAKRLEFDLLKTQQKPSRPLLSQIEEDNVFIEQPQQYSSAPRVENKQVSLDFRSTPTPIENDSPSENSFLNDLNFGFEQSYEDYKF